MKQRKHEAGRFDGNARRGTPPRVFVRVASKGLRGALLGMQYKEAKGKPARRAKAKEGSAPIA